MERWSVESGMMVRRFGSGPELVWIHGLGEWSASFDPIAHHPALAGFTHTLVDLPGYGRSARPAPRTGRPLDAHADLLAGWLAAPAVLIGHSMGGVLATMVAERVAVRAVVNIDGNLTRGDCTFSALATGYSNDDFCAFGFDEIRADVYRRGNAERALRGYHAGMLAAAPDVFRHDAVDLVDASVTETLADRLVALRAPSLFVAGVPGGICEASRALLARVGARWVGIEPAGHWPFIDQPDAFARAVSEFVHGVPAA